MLVHFGIVMISIERSETSQKSTLEIRDKMQSKTKLILRIFFPMVGENFFFGLNFVSDYILQLYFVCNLLIACVFKYSRLYPWP